MEAFREGNKGMSDDRKTLMVLFRDEDIEVVLEGDRRYK